MRSTVSRARRPVIQASYVDGLKRRRRAPREAVDAVKAILDADGSADDSVAVAWDGAGATLRIGGEARRASVEIALEEGGRVAKHVPVRGGAVTLPGRLPSGYHRGQVTAGRITREVLLVSAPRAAYQGRGSRSWGVFLPLYSARSERNWGAGNLTDLEDLMRFVAARGGDLVATLPMLAGFYDEPFEPSPYSPASRLFWSEFFLDIERIPELRTSRTAARLVASSGFHREIERLRRAPLVDYRAGMALRRRALEACRRALDRSPARRRAFASYLAAQPETRTYASFRARTERLGSWRAWPTVVPPPDRDRAAYHAYVQFLCAEQLDSVGRTAREAGAHLYLDMPLGVHPAGYDVWRYPDVFASGVSAGAPPDAFFTAGQDWQLPPLLPQAVRGSGYAYPLACLRTLLARADVLRIDHVIGLHRTFWVPDGFSPAEGVFVRWPDPEEWYAILALESHRAGAVVVGEDLGTVPRSVRAAMARHGILRSYVQQEEFDRHGTPTPIRRRSLAAMNTHDMPTFRSFCEGRDISERERRGLLDERAAAKEPGRRRRRIRGLEHSLRALGLLDDGDLLGAALARLAASGARIVLASLQDLLDEREPPNRPGTRSARNWRRKLSKQIERLDAAERLVGRLQRVAIHRSRRRS